MSCKLNKEFIFNRLACLDRSIDRLNYMESKLIDEHKLIRTNINSEILKLDSLLSQLKSYTTIDRVNQVTYKLLVTYKNTDYNDSIVDILSTNRLILIEEFKSLVGMLTVLEQEEGENNATSDSTGV